MTYGISLCWVLGRKGRDGLSRAQPQPRTGGADPGSQLKPLFSRAAGDARVGPLSAPPAGHGSRAHGAPVWAGADQRARRPSGGDSRPPWPAHRAAVSAAEAWASATTATRVAAAAISCAIFPISEADMSYSVICQNEWARPRSHAGETREKISEEKDSRNSLSVKPTADLTNPRDSELRRHVNGVA